MEGCAQSALRARLSGAWGVLNHVWLILSGDVLWELCFFVLSVELNTILTALFPVRAMKAIVLWTAVRDSLGCHLDGKHPPCKLSFFVLLYVAVYLLHVFFAFDPSQAPCELQPFKLGRK